MRIDPSDGDREMVELDVLELLGQQGGRRPSDAIYFGGYDANSVPAHNTGWVFCAPLETVLSGG